MKKFFLTAILFSFLTLSSNVLAQISPEEYKSQTDSLRALLQQLKSEMATMKSDIDSLKEFSMRMDAKIDSAKIGAYVKKYGRDIGMQVASGQIWKGMSEEMMLDSWGEPDKRSTNKEKWGTFSQWRYGEIEYFFRDGKLTDWEEWDKKKD